jgi:hypothetical protein
MIIITGTLPEGICTCVIISCCIRINMRTTLDKVAEKMKTHIHVQQHFSENRAVYEILWKNRVKPDRPQMRI